MLKWECEKCLYSFFSSCIFLFLVSLSFFSGWPVDELHLLRWAADSCRAGGTPCHWAHLRSQQDAHSWRQYSHHWLVYPSSHIMCFFVLVLFSSATVWGNPPLCLDNIRVGESSNVGSISPSFAMCAANKCASWDWICYKSYTALGCHLLVYRVQFNLLKGLKKTSRPWRCPSQKLY